MTGHFYEISTIAIIVSAIVSPIISVLILIFLYHQLDNIKKQTKNLDLEIKNRVRPWIKIDPMLITYGKLEDHTKSWGDCKPTDKIIKILFKGSLKNVGSLLSKDILIKTVHSPSPINKNNFHEFNPDDDKITLLPDEVHPLGVSIHGKDFDKLNKTPLYYGVHVKYFYDDTNQESFGKIFKINRDGTTMSEYWHDEPPNIKYD